MYVDKCVCIHTTYNVSYVRMFKHMTYTYICMYVSTIGIHTKFISHLLCTNYYLFPWLDFLI